MAVGGVTFPSWERAFGWRATGARTDTVGGREVTTVFYANSRGQRIGYAIAAGPRPGGQRRRGGMARRRPPTGC